MNKIMIKEKVDKWDLYDLIKSKISSIEEFLEDFESTSASLRESDDDGDEVLSILRDFLKSISKLSDKADQILNLIEKAESIINKNE